MCGGSLNMIKLILRCSTLGKPPRNAIDCIRKALDCPYHAHKSAQAFRSIVPECGLTYNLVHIIFLLGCMLVWKRSTAGTRKVTAGLYI